MKRKAQKRPFAYSLLLVDEFQNYLPEQLRIFKECTDSKTRSILYVGDLAQQTQFGTIQEWSQVSEVINSERSVRLQKVYRNTKNILEYIHSLGFSIEIPEGIEEGKPVQEVIKQTAEEEIAYISGLLSQMKEGTLGVLTKDPAYLEPFKLAFAQDSRVHILSIREAQGVEFEIVCLVGVSKELFTVQPEAGSPAYMQEKRRVSKDLLYVALTRAISELHILGTDKL